MEVWFPLTLEEKCGVARLDRALVDALTESLGMARLHPMCLFWRNLQAPALLCDSGFPNLSTEGKSALVHLNYYKAPPLVPPYLNSVLSILEYFINLTLNLMLQCEFESIQIYASDQFRWSWIGP
jgi:hypothetical protein